MSTQALTLSYNQPVRVHVYGKQASNALNGTITSISGTPTNSFVTITPVSGTPNEFDVTNTNPTQGGSGVIAWSATNELQQVVTGNQGYSLVPSDPAVSLEIHIV